MTLPDGGFGDGIFASERILVGFCLRLLLPRNASSGGLKPRSGGLLNERTGLTVTEFAAIRFE